ncbi:protein containing Peptidase S11, D-alanyl-D-alanine carboxypeptidase A domain protein, partial [gut metagenome]
SDYATGAQKLDVSQGTVPFIDESDPLMQNLAVYMVELTTDTLIHSRNADVQKYPASLTKIMTAILTLEHFPDLSQELTFTAELQNYVYEINVSYGGGISTGGIVLNETLTVEQLLYAIMLPSANEAAVMLAYEMGDGSL